MAGTIALSNTINISLQNLPSGLGSFAVNNVVLLTNEKPLSTNPYIWAISAEDVINEYGTNSKTADIATYLFTPPQNLRSASGQLLIFPYNGTDATSATLTTEGITQDNIINFQKVTNGTFTIVIDGTAYVPFGLDFSAVNTVADIVAVLNNIGLDCNISVVNTNQIQFQSRRFGEDGSILLKETNEVDLFGADYLGIATAQTGAGTDRTPEVPATAGTTTTEPLTENVTNFQSVSDGILTLEIDGTDYQFTALDFQQANDVTKIANVIQTAITGEEATAGNTTTPDIQANVAGFQSVSDGVLTLEVDGVSSTVTELDFSSASTLELIKTQLSEKIQNVTITVENENQLRFTSNTTGANSSVKLVETAEPEGIDLYQATYLNGAAQVEQQGKNKPSCTVSVVDEDKIQFTSSTTGASSKVDLKQTEGGGTDIYGVDYLDGETQYIVFGVDMVPAVPSTSAYLTTPVINVDNFKEVSKGTLTIIIDSQENKLQNLNFSNVNDINGIVEVLNGAGTKAGITVLEGNKIQFTTPTAGTAGNISIIETPLTQDTIDIYTSDYLSGYSATTQAGVNSTGTTLQEAMLQAQEIGYCGGVITTQICDNSTIVDNATYIQTTDHVYYEVTQSLQNIAVLGAQLKAAELKKTRLLAYSSNGAIGAKEALAAYATIAQSVNYQGTNTVLTMNLKTLTGIQPDTNLSQTYYNLAKENGVDIYGATEGLSVVYSFDNGYYTDEATTDLWFKKDLEVNGFNYLRQTNTKIPQTQSGLIGLQKAYEQSCIVGVRNGSFAPGTWNGAIPFGNPEDFLRNIEENGYYIYSIPISQQAQAEREARTAPLIQIALKRAGAFHNSNVIITIQR